METEEDGETDADGLGDGDGDGLGDFEILELGEGLGEGLGLSDADGEGDLETDELGLGDGDTEAEGLGLGLGLGELLADGDDPAEAFTSIATPPTRDPVIVISTLVSLSLLNSDMTREEPAKVFAVPFKVKPDPTAYPVSVLMPNPPKVALSALPNAARVTVREDADPVSSFAVTDWTMAPEPFVPVVSIPVNSSIVQ